MCYLVIRGLHVLTQFQGALGEFLHLNRFSDKFSMEFAAVVKHVKIFSGRLLILFDDFLQHRLHLMSLSFSVQCCSLVCYLACLTI